MARVERQVVRLADRPAGRVELRERLRELDEVLEVVVRRIATLEPLADERAAVDGGEDHVLAADLHAPLRVARLQLELRRRLRHLLEDPVRVELDELALDVLARGLEDVERLLVQELDPELAHDAAPAALELLHGEVVEDLVPRHLVDQHRSFSSSRSSPMTPVSRTSSGSSRRAAARSASARSSGFGSWASQTHFS